MVLIHSFTHSLPYISIPAPLVKIKQSMSKLKDECLQMDIRIGVLQHILLRAKLREKNLNALSANQQAIILDDDDDNEFQGY